MKGARMAPASRQKGFVALIGAIFLMAVVIYALNQTLSITSSRSTDGQQQLDSVAALFLAESGVERGQSIISNTSLLTDTVCTGIGTSYSLGRGTISVSAVSFPATCDNSTATNCASCTLTATGTVAQSTRTVTTVIAIAKNNGSSTGKSRKSGVLTLVNPYNEPIYVFLNVGIVRTAASPSERAYSCEYGATNPPTTTCPANYFLWYVKSNEYGSDPSSNNWGVGVPLAANETKYVQLDFGVDEVYAITGGLFKGSGTPIGYWRDNSTNPANPTLNTVNDPYHNSSWSNTYTGSTNSGVATTAAPPSCATPDTNHSGTTRQTCTHWCRGDDTLVLGLAPIANSNSGIDTASSITSITFNTAGSPAQNIPMTRLATFPASSPSVTDDGRSIYSQVWYAFNPDYLSNATATSGGQVTGTVGSSTTFNGTTTTGGTANILTVAAPNNTLLNVGDVISCTVASGCPIPAGTTITQTHTQNASRTGVGGAGTYTISNNATSALSNRAMQATRTGVVLNVTSVANGWLSVGDTLTGTGVTAGTTITSVPGGCTNNTTCNSTGAYGVSTAQYVPSTTVTANGYTIHVSGGTVPASGIPSTNPATMVSVYSDTGLLQANTYVASSPAPTSTLFYLVDSVGNPRPATTRLVNDTICGGTCAFFNDPNNTASTTRYTITHPSPTNLIRQWSGGFTCMNGVTAPSTILPFVNYTVDQTTWTEVVQ